MAHYITLPPMSHLWHHYFTLTPPNPLPILLHSTPAYISASTTIHQATCFLIIIQRFFLKKKKQVLSNPNHRYAETVFSMLHSTLAYISASTTIHQDTCFLKITQRCLFSKQQSFNFSKRNTETVFSSQWNVTAKKDNDYNCNTRIWLTGNIIS